MEWRRFWGVLGATVSAAVACLATSAPAYATCANMVYDETLPTSALAPANGTAFQAAPWTPINFSLRTSLHQLSTISLEVTSQNVLGQDGTLANDYHKELVSMFESDADPDLYTGHSLAAPGWWTDTPGTYYWQAHTVATATINGVFGCHLFATPVTSLSVTSPPPPPVTTTTTTTPPPTPPILMFDDAHNFAASMVKARTHRSPRIFVACSRAGNWTLQCSLNWSAAGSSYRASGRFWDYLQNGQAYWWYDFKGTRSWRTCVRRHHKTRCTSHRQSFHWK